jgi:endonuclease/exonuclease/phosphatase (EEP) superfamily protein YafD
MRAAGRQRYCGIMDRVRVLTLNVCGLPWARWLAPLSRRALEIGAWIEDSDVDVACFQEVWTRGALAALRAGLPSFRHVARRAGPVGPAGGLAVLARLPLGAARYASFGGLVPPAGGTRFRLTRAVNSAGQGVLTVAVGGGTVATTHLTANRDGDWSSDNRHYPFQHAQLARLHAALDRTGGSQLVVGDFNIAADGALYPLIARGWQDPFTATDPVTFHPHFLPAGARSKRIDYMLARGAVVTDPRAVFTGPPPSGLYLSDHIGLSVRVEFA